MEKTNENLYKINSICEDTIMISIPTEYFSNMYISYYYGSLIRCSANWRGIDSVCTYSKFYYILDGECIVEIEGVKYQGKAGRLFLIPSGVKHSFYHANDHYIKKYWFHFSMESGGNNFFNMIQFPYYIDIGQDRKVKSIFRDVLKYAEDNSLHGMLYLKSRIIELVALYFSRAEINEFVSTNNIETGLANVLKYMQQHLTSQITITELADIVHLHPNYFIRFFKEKMGTSPAQYRNKLRMEQAKSLLENTAIPINEIMISVGFQDLSHFSKFFKKYSGYSPKHFREMYQKKGV